MKKSEKEVLRKSIIRSILLILSVISVIMGMLITIESLTNNKEKKEQLVNYETNGKINYTIKLSENDFYDENEIKNSAVLSKYIESIALNFRYEMSASKLIDSTAVYSGKITLVNNYYNNEKKEVLWTKEFDLIPETTITEKEKSIVSFEKTLDIDYDYYNELAQYFANESEEFTEPYLKVEFLVDNDLTLVDTKNKFYDNHTVTLIIPLLENVTSIEKIGEFSEQEALYNISILGINYVQLATGICLIFVSVAFIYTAIKMFLDINNISKYVIARNKILKRYADIIAETSTKPDFKGLEVMEITNMIDLVDIEDELRIPIIYYEAYKGRESWFIINHNDKVYRYILKKKKMK
ncbi:MAG: hypothetical protein J6A52_07855 [Bacilli bacterium]|nr:hypothetical protein [Bacilli bacterium]